MYPTQLPISLESEGLATAGMGSTSMLSAGENRSLVNQNEKDKLVEKLVKLADDKALQDKTERELGRIRILEEHKYANKITWIKCFIKIAIREFHINEAQLRILEKKELILLDDFVAQKAEKMQKTWNFIRWPLGFILIVGWYALMMLDIKWKVYRDYLQARIKLRKAYGENFSPFDELKQALN